MDYGVGLSASFGLLQHCNTTAVWRLPYPVPYQTQKKHIIELIEDESGNNKALSENDLWGSDGSSNAKSKIKSYAAQ